MGNQSLQTAVGVGCRNARLPQCKVAVVCSAEVLDCRSFRLRKLKWGVKTTGAQVQAGGAVVEE